MSKDNNFGRPLLDLGVILKYFALWCVFALIAYGVKMVVLRAIDISPTHQVGNGFLTLYELHNSGAAFNLFSNQPDMIISASFLTVAIITFIIIIASSKVSRTALSAMALLSAGISMNLYERINYGYVIDYINCNFLRDFPVFNVPDIMIVFGALGLILALFTKD